MTDWLSIIPIIIGAIKKAGGLLKPKGKLGKIAKDPDFQQQFLKQNGNNIIFNVKRDLYLGDSGEIPKAINKELLAGLTEGKIKEVKKDVNFFHVDFFQRVEEYSTIKLVDEDIDKNLKHIKSIDLINLFKMSKYIKTLYSNGDSSEANKVRSDIGDQYGKLGRKFCNLYQQDYIHQLVEYLSTKYEGDEEEFENLFESEVHSFLEHSDTIFFIHTGTKHKSVSYDCMNAIDVGYPYIAIHAGNKGNIKTAISILSKIREYAIKNEYNIKEENIESKSKTPLLNIYITKK